MLAGVVRVTCGAAIAMAGLLLVILANCVWIVWFRLQDVILTPQLWEYLDPWTSTVMWTRTDSLIGVAAVIWLVGRVVRYRRGARVCKGG